MPTHFEEVGRLPFVTDNVAIATQDLEAGIEIDFQGAVFKLSHGVLEGHRFAIRSIANGENLLSWGMSFGKALRDIQAGEYVCNDGVLEALRERNIPFELPSKSNFSDEITPFQFDPSECIPDQQVTPLPVQYHFQGYYRGEERGVGTRNHILLLGVSSRVAAFVRHLEKKCAVLAEAFENIDGVVGIAHTEGDDVGLNNRELVLRTLAGFTVHPNTAAVLLIDDGSEAITNQHVLDFIVRYKYPSDQVLLKTMSLQNAFAEPADKALEIVRQWLPVVNSIPKTKQPISHLKIALQCGGSDAFSGISGNPLAGWVAREVIRQGGAANLAETDELVGAEEYILKKVKSPETAERFLATIDRFVSRAARHGSSAAGNPSGGNKYRGLYNIYLKSLGAAMKKHPDVRLDEVIEYGERMNAPGFYFMDSPGNDLESIAGQVASGCNMIYFVTGNGSITNFPFVPTVKIVTTSRRFELLNEDMDVNAGAYLDGVSMDTLGADTLQRTLEVASGVQSVGEEAGHSQVQLWRNWRQPENGENRLSKKEVQDESLLSGEPLSMDFDAPLQNVLIQGYHTSRGPAFERLGLIMPTSLCSGQVARMAAESMNTKDVRSEYGVDRFVALVHTEGCGASSGNSENIFMRTMCGHLMHANVAGALLLEHGCEKTHNDHFQSYFNKHNIDSSAFGWASIQLGGGIKKTLEYIDTWFKQWEPSDSLKRTHEWGLGALKLGIVVDPDVQEDALQQIRTLAQSVVKAGGTVIIPRVSIRKNAMPDFLSVSQFDETLAYGQYVENAGLHIMDTPSRNWQEMITGMGASGVNVFVYVGNDAARSGHPFIPLLQFSNEIGLGDLPINQSDDWFNSAFERIKNTLAGTYQPVRWELGNIDFQITRGLFGISL